MQKYFKVWSARLVIHSFTLVLAAVSFAQDRGILRFETGDTLDVLGDKIKQNGYNFTVGHNWVYDMAPEQKEDGARHLGSGSTTDIRIKPTTLTFAKTSTTLPATPAAAPTASMSLSARVRAPNTKLLIADQVLGSFTNGQDRVAVIVNLVPPARALQPTDWHAAQSRQTLHAANRAAAEEVLKTLGTDEHKLRFRFDNQAGFSCEVTQQALDKLLNNPQVESIEPVRELQAHLAQGIPLMNALTSRSTYTGAGIAIAICDTGIDYNHPRLGGGGFPNSKVIGGYDFGDSDANPIPNGQAHGTCCAGIAAGDLGTVGDYIGGVAPAAKLYACKISYGTTGSATSDAMVAAWDWCVTHRNDNPAYPIMVISTSFGGGREFSACDGDVPAMTTAANNAVAAGITVLASSGNDGYCDSIAWPACISSVISVGAVYDANFGTYLPCVNAASCAPKTATGGCATGYYATDNTQPDRVTSYSNVASFLGVFAPANKCYTADISGSSGYSTGDYYDSFGGTSAACPYAAGAVACLQHAAKMLTGSYLTPSQVRARLAASGDLITDTKVAITKPRVNLGRAINTLSAYIVMTNATPGDTAGGNGNGTIDPGETINETVVLANLGSDSATNVSATLSTGVAGITVTAPSAAYPDLPSGALGTNLTSFVYRLAKTVSCGTVLSFTNIVTASGKTYTNTFSHIVGQAVAGGAVTNNFDSADIPKTIPDVTTIYSTNIIATTGVIDDVNVTVRLNHTYDGDLTIAIQHPDSTEVVLAQGRGSSGDNFGTGTCGAGEVRTTFDDEAANPISAGSAPFAGSFRPEGVLSNLDGRPLNGTWRLRVTDSYSRDTGTLYCWGLRIISHQQQCVCSVFNTAPVASNQSVTITVNTATNLVLTGCDPDGDPISFGTNSLPAHGTLSNFNPSTGVITYAPANNYSGPDSFTFVVNDGMTNSAPAAVSMTITEPPSPWQQWQLNYFGCTNCSQAAETADPDGDGQNNLTEFLAGTDPTNSVSRLQIISMVPQDNDLVITWTTAGGRTNVVQATAGDVEGGYTTNFIDISGLIIIPGSGDTTTNYVDFGGATNAPSRFYRVRLVP